MRPSMTLLSLPLCLLACAEPEPATLEGPTDVITEVTTSSSTTTSSTSTTTTTTTTTGGTTTSFAIGPNDAIAQAGCDLFLGNPTNLVAVSDQGDAGQVVIQPSDVESWMVALPQADQGYFTLEIGEWDTTQAFFAYADNSYGVWVADGDIQYDRYLNGACPNEGITDQRIFFDHWTPATIRFETNGPRDAWFAVVKES